MAVITTSAGTSIYHKDWGLKDSQPVMFYHGWPLSVDNWDSQMLFFHSRGDRVIAHDRRGHGRSDQTDTGNEMDAYAADVTANVTALSRNRAQFYKDIPSGPFYGFNRKGAEVSQGLIDNWWRPGYGRRREGALRLHQSIFGDRLYRRFGSDRRSSSFSVRRRRPDRPNRELGAQGNQAGARR